MWFVNLLSFALSLALAPKQVPAEPGTTRLSALTCSPAWPATPHGLPKPWRRANGRWRASRSTRNARLARVGLFFQAGQAFQQGDMAKGGPLWDRGLAEMNEAVSLAPDSLAVVIPRGSVLLQAARFVPPPMAEPLLKTGVGDYEHVLELQRSYFHTLGDHPKGELLFGLADGYARLGDKVKARAYFERLIAEAPTSGQAPRGRAWIETGAVPPAQGLGCFGCHK